MITSTNIGRLLILCCLMCFTGCKKNEVETAREQAVKILTSGTWHEPAVTIDGVDHSDLYKNFSITFTSTGYSTTGGAPVWRPSGTWSFVDDDATRMKLDDSVDIDIVFLPEDVLELTFQWSADTFEPGRVVSVKGKQKFKLKK